MLMAYVGAAMVLGSGLVMASREVAALLAPAEGAHAVGSPTDRPAVLAHARAFACAAVTAVVAGVVVIDRWWATAPVLATLVVLLLPLLTALAAIDVAVHRLPDRLTALTAALTVLGVVFACTAGELDGWEAAHRAAVGAIASGGFYFLLALLGGGQGMGLGDVKLAPSLGAMAALVGWNTWLTAAVLAFLLGGAWGVVLMARGRGRSARMPFGPFMIAGALVAVCTS